MFRPIRVDHTNCLQVAIKTHSFINGIRHAEGHDMSHYLCGMSDFHFECKGQGITVQDSYVVIPDNNNLFSYVTMLEELHDVSTSTAPFTKIGEVYLQERKVFGQDPPGSCDSTCCLFAWRTSTQSQVEIEGRCTDTFKKALPYPRGLSG
jgi:hypothetical protein